MAHAGIRRAILGAGGVPGAGRMATHAGAPIDTPFGSAEIVEGDRIRAIPVAPAAVPDAVAYLDGIQRYAVEGWFGITPAIRAHVAAAVLRRAEGQLLQAAHAAEDMVVAPLARLSAAEAASLAVGDKVRVYDAAPDTPPHPLLDLQAAVLVVERRRSLAELAVARRYRERDPGGWLLVDGSVSAHPDLQGDPRVLGIVKSHETQFLQGDDLTVALTLPAGHRSSVFAPRYERGGPVHSWYLRLWPREGEDIFYGLIRVERALAPRVGAEADEISGWLLRERAPLSTPDGRWDRLLYPIHRVEEFLRARAGSWA